MSNIRKEIFRILKFNIGFVLHAERLRVSKVLSKTEDCVNVNVKSEDILEISKKV